MPHDSVCGCSVDEVHRDMLYRYDQVFEIADYLMYEVGNFGGIDTKDLKGDGFVAVFNSPRLSVRTSSRPWSISTTT